MKKVIVMVTVMMVLVLHATSYAFLVDFEDGVDGANVNDILGVSFLSFNGFEPLYADCRAGLYNCFSDDLGYGNGSQNYHHYGNFTVWAGPQADAQGVKVDFTNNDGTWFTTGYSSFSNFTLEAWLTDGSMVSTLGAANTGGPMQFLTVNATSGLFIDYLVLHDTGNYWIVDNMSGDASGVNPVPEPTTLFLLGIGVIGILALRKNIYARYI